MKALSRAHRRATSLLAHPLVLQSAWRKVRTWYASGEWAPSAELAQWLSDPDLQLARLSSDLLAGTYKPSIFPLIPYPKKGTIVRHYTLPSVRDQVALATFAVLLAPILESRMPNFSFGNRWHRRLYRKPILSDDNQLHLFAERQTSQARAVWAQRAASLSDNRFYQPYPRSHGLFRRVAHWSAAAMLDVAVTDTSATDAPKDKADYATDSLPPFVNADWWESPTSAADGDQFTSSPKRGYFVRLDLQLAYPSLRLPHLDSSMKAALSNQLQIDSEESLSRFNVSLGQRGIKAALAGYPSDVVESILIPQVRLALAERLMALLKQVTYAPLENNQHQDSDLLWRPPHTRQALPIKSSDHTGIPTGLAISGFLMNVHLLGFDIYMTRWLLSEKAKGKPAALLRFADDVTLIAPSLSQLMSAVDALWEGLCRSTTELNSFDPPPTHLSCPQDSHATTNLQINWSKVEPPSIASIVSDYLRSQGWEQCSGCDELILNSSFHITSRMKLADWFQDLKREASIGKRGSPSAFHERIIAIETEAIHPGRLQPFVTYLVERLSTVGRDSLAHRFGPAVQDRLVQLHELVRFELQDQQVREDTRLSFAANRLATAWLPEESASSDRESLRQIRRSVQIAVSKAPWKFNLWRAVIRAAARRPPGRSDEHDEREATAWLCQMASMIALSSEDNESQDVDIELGSLQWGASKEHQKCWDTNLDPSLRSVDYSRLYRARHSLLLSHLRTAFWLAIADTLSHLSRVKSKLRRPPESEGLHPIREWSSRSWSFRAMSEQEIEVVTRWLSGIDAWANCLYPNPDKNFKGKLQAWWWEMEGLSLAALSTIRRSELIQNFSPQKNRQLQPVTAHAGERIRLSIASLTLLSRFASLTADILTDRSTPLRPTWMELSLTNAGSDTPDESSGAASRLARLSKGDWDTRGSSIAVSRLLGVADYFPTSAIKILAHETADLLEWCNLAATLPERFRRLRIYKNVRDLNLSIYREEDPSRTQKPSIYRLLWGRETETSQISCRTWLTAPNLAPSIGLPVRIALAMLGDALDHELQLASDGVTAKSIVPSISSPPTWLLHDRSLELLSLGRAIQIGASSLPPEYHTKSGSFSEPLIVVDDGVVDIPPHPLFFLPWLSVMTEQEARTNRIWVHLLLFYTVLEGSERLLNTLYEDGIGIVPFKERWDLRSRISLPVKIWELLDELMRACGPREGLQEPYVDLMSRAYDLRDVIGLTIRYPRISIHDFRWEKVEVRLDLMDSLEVPHAILPFAYSNPLREPQSDLFKLREEDLVDEVTVRMGQVSAHPDWERTLESFPTLNRSKIQEIMRQVWSTAYSSTSTEGKMSTGPNILILPEVTIPRSEIPSIHELAQSLNIAVFCGLYWRVVSSAHKEHGLSPFYERVVTNEALLVVPLSFPEDSGPPLARHFFVEKPIPASIEIGLARALTIERPNTRWRVLPGRRWWRFVHPQWGDFTVAICSDLLDASPWASLRGQIMHLLMCAYNKDVELYEALTWVRAYESYVNVISVNHGEYGGSFAWTPKHKGRNELARLRGNSLLLTADIQVPVKALWQSQRSGVEDANRRAADLWLHRPTNGGHFKAPPRISQDESNRYLEGR